MAGIPHMKPYLESFVGEKWHGPMRLCKHRFAEALQAAHPPWGEPFSAAGLSPHRQAGTKTKDRWLSPLQGAYCKLTRPQLLPEGAGPINLNKRRKARGSTRSPKESRRKDPPSDRRPLLLETSSPKFCCVVRQQEKSGYKDSQELMKTYGSQECPGSVNTLGRGAQACLLCLCKKASHQCPSDRTTGKHVRAQ